MCCRTWPGRGRQFTAGDSILFGSTLHGDGGVCDALELKVRVSQVAQPVSPRDYSCCKLHRNRIITEDAIDVDTTQDDGWFCQVQGAAVAYFQVRAYIGGPVQPIRLETEYVYLHVCSWQQFSF